MSQRQRLPESEAAAALELLTLREEIAELALSETRLKLQVLRLQAQIASQESSGSRPKETSAAYAEGDSPERIAALQAQLADAQEQLARLATQKDEMAARQKAAQKRLNDLRSDLQSDATWRQSAPPWVETKAPQPKRAQKPLVILLSGLLLILVLGSLIHFSHVSSLDLSLLANSPSGSSPRAVPPEEPPFYTPAKTAPTNEGCVTTIKVECYSPEYIQQALGLTQLYKEGFTGSGQTIVLVGAGRVTTLPSDLHQFDLAWGLPDPNLTVLHPDGPPSSYDCPDGEDRLQYDNILNVEWAHAIAPGANIVLLIGSNLVDKMHPEKNCVYTSLQQDLGFALDHSLGNSIGVSYGSSELGNVTDTDAQKTAAQQYYAAGHLLMQRATADHVTVVAAVGDSGATNPSDYPQDQMYWPTHNVSWPASDPDVLAVGGTVLTLGNDYHDDAYNGETAWTSPEAGATGGGLSTIFAEPDYQKSIPNQALFQGKRGVPDVTFPATNLLIYNTDQDGALIKANPQWSHWDLAESTTVATSAWAGLIAIANQIHGLPLGLIQPALYRLQGQGLHDITSGNNTYENVPGYQAQRGFDLVSGWGTPFAQNFIPALLQANDDIIADCGTQQSQCT